MENQELTNERSRLFRLAGGGIQYPLAGATYWLGLAILSNYTNHHNWTYLAFFTSGIIFPLGMLYGKILKMEFKVESPLGSLTFAAMGGMLMFWAIIIPAVRVDITLAPLILGIGMALHWPAIGWMYNCKSCYVHAGFRAVGTCVIWFLFPDNLFLIIPLYTAAVYLLSVVGIKYELKLEQKQAKNAYI